jgi:YebC/PmpR family DNA-binding regulatory protein
LEKLDNHKKNTQTFFFTACLFYFCTYIKKPKREMGRAFEFRKGRKMKRWSAMAKAFTRIGKDIVMAVKEGGPNPEANSRLRAVIQNSKAVNMPKENVERAIKKATDKDTANYKEILFEGYAPHGIAILIETASDNNNRTVANIRSYFNKCNGTMGTQGSVEFMFDHTCNFRIPAAGQDIDELELEMIDFGVEEIFADDEDGILMYAPFESFGAIQKELESRGLEILSSGFDRIPQVTKELTPEQVADVEKLLEKIEEDDDVMNVFHTMVEN